MGNKNGQVFVLSQEIEEEAGHLSNLPPSYPGMAPFPVCLPPRESTFLSLRTLNIRRRETGDKNKREGV